MEYPIFDTWTLMRLMGAVGPPVSPGVAEYAEVSPRGAPRQSQGSEEGS